MVKFGMHGCFTSKILLFYRKHHPVVDVMTGAVTSSGIHAIIHNCKYREATSTKRTKKFHETHLCSRWVAESIPKPLAMMPTMHGLTEITQLCVHMCNGLFICQLYLLPDLLEEMDCKEDMPLTLPFASFVSLTVDNSDMN
jgi:hypothetical protein